MKKLDMLTPLGMAVGLTLVAFAIISSGGVMGFATFIDFASFCIVIGGIMAALLINFPLKDLKHFFHVMKESFMEEPRDISALINRLVQLSEIARREGLLSLESGLQKEDEPLLQKGILLAVDGIEQEELVEIMMAETDALEERHRKGRLIVEKAGEYAPSWGMIGTLIGLVLMLKNLNDPALLGPNMAIALLTTLYGSLLANLVFLPMASKLELKTEEEVFYRQIIIEGVAGVQSGQNPNMLREKLNVFLIDPYSKGKGEKAEEEIEK
ncbi:MotA/TolQ/ExbB proton channel family protein [Domibacillus mangrovi]|uniref:Motility protein A n=1 Tax=Domibacillus mangrovi TaxID=1714354 RepID=A0A1Q5P1W9_9BACI|nr:MotA/TolQ/ExbB proton channel family protein [Domibacillus mangrovi]OKL36216.1 motility protein A [Domibacillus mangrovi]